MMDYELCTTLEGFTYLKATNRISFLSGEYLAHAFIPPTLTELRIGTSGRHVYVRRCPEPVHPPHNYVVNDKGMGLLHVEEYKAMLNDPDRPRTLTPHTEAIEHLEEMVRIGTEALRGPQ